MTNEKLKYIRNTIKNIHENHLTLIELEIVLEIDDTLTTTLTEEEYSQLYNEIEYAYLKLDNVAISTITRCAIDHLEKILHPNAEPFDLREESCYYV